MKIHRSIPAEVRRRVDLDGNLSAFVESGLVVRSRANMAEARRTAAPLEIRENDDGTVHLTGYATTWETSYDVAGGPPWGWTETIARGAASKSLAERDDVRFLINHEGLALARNASRTMTLEADDLGLLVDVPALDVRSNVFSGALASAIRRGDVDQMSFAFYVHRQEWNDDYTERRISELELVDVSAVTYPANPATIIGLRSAALADSETQGRSLTLAAAQAFALR